MSQRAFIVKLSLQEDNPDLGFIAQDIADALTQDGYSVLDVKPWASPEDAVAQASSLFGNTQAGQDPLSIQPL